MASLTTRGAKQSSSALPLLGRSKAWRTTWVGGVWGGRHLFCSYYLENEKHPDPNSGSVAHSSSTVSFLESSSFWSRTWGAGLGRAATSAAAREEESCCSTILREDGSSCRSRRTYDNRCWRLTKSSALRRLTRKKSRRRHNSEFATANNPY